MDEAIARRALQARLVANVIALGEEVDVQNISNEGKRLFFEAIKLEAANLRDLSIESTGSINNFSTSENDSPSDRDEDHLRHISSIRLLQNIATIGDLTDLSTISEEGKTLFWEVVKLEIKTFKKINLTECSKKKIEASNEQLKTPDTFFTNWFGEDYGSDSDSISRSSSSPLLGKKKKFGREKWLHGVNFRSKKAYRAQYMNLDPSTSKQTDLNSSFNSGAFVSLPSRNFGTNSKFGPKREHNHMFSFSFFPRLFASLGTLDDSSTKLSNSYYKAEQETHSSSSSPSSGNERKFNQKKRHKSMPFLASLPLLFPSPASKEIEWRRSAQGPLEESGVMEMVFYVTEKCGTYSIDV